MQIIKSYFRLIVFISPVLSFAQTTYLPQGSKEYQLIDRLEIKQQQNTDLNFSTLKPYSRKSIVRQAEYLDSARIGYSSSLTREDDHSRTNLTPVDEYNLSSLLVNNAEWVTGSQENFISRKPILKDRKSVV